MGVRAAWGVGDRFSQELGDLRAKIAAAIGDNLDAFLELGEWGGLFDETVGACPAEAHGRGKDSDNRKNENARGA